MYHKAKIRMHFNFRKSTTKDAENMIEWLSKLVFSYNENTDNLVQLTWGSPCEGTTRGKLKKNTSVSIVL